MKNFTRTMHERVYNVMVYVASEDKVEKVDIRKYEASKNPEGVEDNILVQGEACKALRQNILTDRVVQLSIPINVFVKAAQEYGIIKVIGSEE